jgi:site-specific recombinase XerD
MPHQALPRHWQQLLGHSSVGTTELYCAIDDYEISAVMEAAL